MTAFGSGPAASLTAAAVCPTSAISFLPPLRKAQLSQLPPGHAVAVLAQFARAEGLEAAQVTAIGAFERATVGWFDRAARQYRRIPVDEQCEVLSLIGDVLRARTARSCMRTSFWGCRMGPRAEVTSSREWCSPRWRSW